MSTQEERKELVKEPLAPASVTIAVLDYVKDCPADRVLTNILLIDEQIDSIQRAISPHMTSLTMQRNALLQRAKDEKIISDSNAVMVEIPGKKQRNEISDIDGFHMTFPEGYKQIRETQKKDLDDKHEKAIAELEDSDIPLGLADKKVGKDKVTEFVGFKPTTITYEVRKRLKTE